jgi:hypothetical protein
MPSLDDANVVLENHAPDLIELAWAETPIPGQNGRFDPELGLISLTTDVNVHRFGTVEGCRGTASAVQGFQRCAAR